MIGNKSGVRPCPICTRRGRRHATWSPCACTSDTVRYMERDNRYRARRVRHRLAEKSLVKPRGNRECRAPVWTVERLRAILNVICGDTLWSAAGRAELRRLGLTEPDAHRRAWGNLP